MADTHSTQAHADPAAVHHETSDVSIAGVLGFAAGLFVAAVLIHFMIWLLFLYFSGREAGRATLTFPLAAGQEHRLPPEPRLQSNPRQDLRDLRAAEDGVLNSYGWVNKNAGIVRIPIGEAMKMIVQRGLPARPATKDAGSKEGAAATGGTAR
jgi:hypothetical protein